MDGGAAKARLAGARAGRWMRQNKIITGVSAAFVVAIIVVSAVTSASSAPGPSPAPNFTLGALGSPAKKISLAQYAGQPLILNFYGSWCEDCQTETPLIASWYKQQHGRVNLIGLDEADTAGKAEKWDAAKGVTYPVAFDPDVTVPGQYDMAGYPYTFFLNAKHEIVYRVIGPITTTELNKGLRLIKSAA